jgi:3-hydroxymyristoyl/3-hydroxydecanoyl-(acyl carrier protein) dehydratase
MLESMLQTLSEKECLVLTIPHEHPSYAGHFPNFPIVPGVLCLAIVLTAVFKKLDISADIEQLSSVKFMAPVYPGDKLLVEYMIKDNKLTLNILNDALKAVSVVAIFKIQTTQ